MMIICWVIFDEKSDDYLLRLSDIDLSKVNQHLNQRKE